MLFYFVHFNLRVTILVNFNNSKTDGYEDL
jgi:hypothetical protein